MNPGRIREPRKSCFSFLSSCIIILLRFFVPYLYFIYIYIFFSSFRSQELAFSKLRDTQRDTKTGISRRVYFTLRPYLTKLKATFASAMDRFDSHRIHFPSRCVIESATWSDILAFLGAELSAADFILPLILHKAAIYRLHVEDLVAR